MFKVSNRLAELRKQVGIKQEVLAMELNISRVTLSRYENNQVTIPKKMLDKICSYFNIELKDLIIIDTEEDAKARLKFEELDPILLNIVFELQFLKSSVEVGLEAIRVILENLSQETKKKLSNIDSKLKRRSKNKNQD
ncbi:MAG: helix-turn-helix domain-containing protein [Raineya sp.]|jgi:transcriptional regulator with XRE-family HTH domain|nr:helix-turn-helix domain-containing protein [Raineya sp.]